MYSATPTLSTSVGTGSKPWCWAAKRRSDWWKSSWTGFSRPGPAAANNPMPIHDIIDDRNEKLVDHINRILSSTEAARFAVGYFFLSGLTCIAGRLERVRDLKLLIGNTTNRETLEQLAEGYRRLEMVADAAEAQAFPKRTETKRMAGETADNIRTAVELMDQTDEGQTLVNVLVRLIEEKRLKVRLYTKGRMHAKAYIFDYGDVFDL